MAGGVQLHPGNLDPFRVFGEPQRRRTCLEVFKQLYEKIAKAVVQFFTYLIACMCCKRPAPVPVPDPRVPVVPMPGPQQPEAEPIVPAVIIQEPQPGPEPVRPPEPIQEEGSPVIEPPAPPNPVNAIERARAQEEIRLDLDLQIPIETPEMPPAPEIETDQAANLNALREVLQGNQDENLVWGARLRRQMTPRNFIALLDEFPGETNRIARWAIQWAQARPIKIDPNHPYFEIFQAAIQNKNAIDGGVGASANDQDYELGAYGEDYYMNAPKFLYLMYSLMGFQELTRPDIRELLRRLDNHENTIEQNPGYRFGAALSKINVYPTRIDGSRPNDHLVIARIRAGRRERGEDENAPIQDVEDKIHLGITVPWKGYQLAKIFHEVPEFFQGSFATLGYNENCFDARLSSFQSFMVRYLAPPDFNVDLHMYSSIQDCVLEHFRVFQNEQLLKYAKASHLDYKTIKHWVYSYGISGIQTHPAINDLDGNPIDRAQIPIIIQQLQTFNQNWLRPEDFEAYLVKNQHPFKHLALIWDIHEHRLINKPMGEPLSRREWMAHLVHGGMKPDHWVS